MKKLTILTLLCSSILLTGCNNMSSKNAEVKDQPTEKNNSKSIPKTKEETSSEIKKANYYSYLDEVDRSNIQSSTVESFLMYDNTNPKIFKKTQILFS